MSEAMNADETRTEAEKLDDVTEGDHLILDGDEHKVLFVSRNDRGTAFVDLRNLDSYSPGTKTVKQGNNGGVHTHGRGMTARNHTVELPDDESGEERVEFDGVVRSLAEDEARAAFTGDETAREVFGRFSTVIAVRSPDEVDAVLDMFEATLDENDLTARQQRAIRSAAGRLRSAKVRLGGDV